MEPLLLTIAIPTYNRASCLALLLRVLVGELSSSSELQKCVRICVLDNKSSDETPNVIAKYESECPSISAIKQPINIGADRNILSAILDSTSTYVWIMGDDDLPKIGLIAKVVSLLKGNSLQAVYLRAQWIDGDLEPHLGNVGATDFACCSSRHILANASINVTFISSWILNATTYKRIGVSNAAELIGTNFVQLDWVLKLLVEGGSFAVAQGEPLLARSGNTGGYSVLKTFGVNFQRIVRERLGEQSAAGRYLTGQMFWGFLPGLIKAYRAKQIGAVLDESIERVLVQIGEERGAGWLPSRLLYASASKYIIVAECARQTMGIVAWVKRKSYTAGWCVACS